MTQGYRLLEADNGAVTRALIFFGFVIAAALSLSVLFAVLVINLFGVPAGNYDFMLMTVVIAACVASPMAGLAAQNQYRVDRYQTTLEAMASTDPLTGLLNRRSFKTLAEEELARMERTRNSVYVALFDLDHFKRVNDTYGHAFGDRVLVSIANLSHAALRGPFDRLGRWGGEEFIILLSEVNQEQAEAVCERLRKRIAGTEVSINGKMTRVSASFGLAKLRPEDGLTACIEKADGYLYEAKNGGRNCVRSEPRIRSAA
ncbi:GGDEF domain-containing protein [Henriciella marina]|uniref:diguanylate cyclase n=1 Tax=Henriciella marina TaxID=453851 RepID=A0ABT4LWE8_9PROT|nr:GGDEF domain-containing protein [Henriciella marina]MCZ4298692.1 GGDEF domain-containing protein [Henriciella marina]